MGFDQINKDYFNLDNVFDVEGLIKLIQEIEECCKKCNDIEQEIEVLICCKNLEVEQESLQILCDQEYVCFE